MRALRNKMKSLILIALPTFTQYMSSCRVEVCGVFIVSIDQRQTLGHLQMPFHLLTSSSTTFGEETQINTGRSITITFNA